MKHMRVVCMNYAPMILITIFRHIWPNKLKRQKNLKFRRQTAYEIWMRYDLWPWCVNQEKFKEFYTAYGIVVNTTYGEQLYDLRKIARVPIHDETIWRMKTCVQKLHKKTKVLSSEGFPFVLRSSRRQFHKDLSQFWKLLKWEIKHLISYEVCRLFRCLFFMFGFSRLFIEVWQRFF